MQVTRRRRRVERAATGASAGRSRRVRLATAGTATLALVVTGTGIGTASTQQFGTQHVTQQTKDGMVVSSDQYLSPIGDRLVVNNGKIMASSISPDGTHLAALTTDGGIALTIVDLKSYKVQQLIGNSSTANLKIAGNDVGQEGPSYSPDGKFLWLAQTDGYTKFSVNADGTLANPVSVKIPADGPKHALVAQAVFSPDGTVVYAAVNGQNRVVAINAATGAVLQSWNTGIAPRDLVLVGNKLYASNEGGRMAKPGETTINSYNTPVPADPATGASTTGTVSVIDTANPAAAVKSIDVGLHPTALYTSKGTVFVANTSSNSVSVIDSAKDQVVQTIATQPWPEASVGYEPDGITLTQDGHLLVTLGRANAIAVYRYASPKEPTSYIGLLPTDYFPTAIATVGKDIVVSNTRGIDAQRPTTAAGHGTHDTTASVQRFQLPDDQTIKSYTPKVFKQNGWTENSVQVANDNRNKKPVPVPQRLGDPSTIKHVFLIVKENRTYDQLYGDMPQGNGDAALAQFGESVTPNQHALAQQFGLYDNTYDIGTNSAEGHNWLMQADDPEYTESSAGEYLRSYDTENDVLGHQKSGFIWTGAQAAGKSVKDYGEFQSLETKPAGGTWQNYYCDAKNMAATGEPSAYPIKTGSAIPSLNDVSVPGFPLFDTSVPDVYKEQVWQQDFEKNGPANLNMFWLSNDHTGGPASPAAQVADNDLATGRIVDEISHSPYWKDSAIFVVEDDSQAGLDHVDGHRAPIQVISPYAQHGVVDNRYYSQITMIRTIEQILGIQPMNQKDSAATPMATAFTNKPDFTPFTAVPNRTSLTAGLATQPSCGSDTVAPQFAAVQPPTAVPAEQQQVASQWATWQKNQHFTGPGAIPDSANPEQMDHFTWYQVHGWKTPYPGENKIYSPDQVPGAYIPSAETDG
ncbi:alkaline phosphatase family protein [Amycolatopsis sp. NPDC051903]|uniref:alkaline phosphatase family protein n=1 Tax=Amycolatopsis sp. NPDC051903 TaxID=3363936 RepID=UPI0037874B9C